MANFSRRKFLKDSTCAAMGSTAFLSAAINLGVFNTLAARPHILGNSNDYKAIVCILLSGGCDTYNILVPTENGAYAEYQTTRNDIALDRLNPEELVALERPMGEPEFSVHGRLTEIKTLFDTNKLSFIANIGTLNEPIATNTEYFAGAKRPLGLFSHSDQQMQWQTSLADSRIGVGFGGRLADILHDMNTIDKISMNISLAGKNRFQVGQNTAEFSIANDATAANLGYNGYPSYYSESGFLNDNKNGTINSLADQTYNNIFQQTIGSVAVSTAESIEIYKTALAKLTPISTEFSDTRLSKDLKKTAELISVQQDLGLNRQVFFVRMGGFDNHGNLLDEHNMNLPELNNALFEFKNALEEIGKFDEVLTFTISDFARTLTSNGSGSDHAWGGNQMIMGGAIKGGEIFGEYPSLSLDGNLNITPRGVLIPTTAVDEFYAEVALWFGVSPNDLDYVLPNLCRFYDSSNCTTSIPNDYMPLGMFQ